MLDEMLRTVKHKEVWNNSFIQTIFSIEYVQGHVTVQEIEQ